MLHARDMLPPVRELIEEHELQVVTAEIEDVYERDEKSGVLIRVGKTNPTHGIAQMVPTGRMVESYETPGEGDAVVVHEGSMKQADLLCGDCGSLLKPANDRDFYYLLCSRLDERAHDVTTWIARNDEGEPVIRKRTLKGEEPYENCVLECGNVRLGEPD
jgi:hypothetical protein